MRAVSTCAERPAQLRHLRGEVLILLLHLGPPKLPIGQRFPRRRHPKISLREEGTPDRCRSGRPVPWISRPSGPSGGLYGTSGTLGKAVNLSGGGSNWKSGLGGWERGGRDMEPQRLRPGVSGFEAWSATAETPCPGGRDRERAGWGSVSRVLGMGVPGIEAQRLNPSDSRLRRRGSMPQALRVRAPALRLGPSTAETAEIRDVRLPVPGHIQACHCKGNSTRS